MRWQTRWEQDVKANDTEYRNLNNRIIEKRARLRRAQKSMLLTPRGQFQPFNEAEVPFEVIVDEKPGKFVHTLFRVELFV